MDQIEDISSEFVAYKSEQCIQIRVNDGTRDGRILLTNSVSKAINSLLSTDLHITK